jgi:hypothetical protein
MEEEEEIIQPPKVLYKYRGIDNWQFFVDILFNNRLYAAKYKDMNDPMEGKYYYHSGKLDEKIREKLSEGKEKLKICSLSETNDNFLMWSHYANGHRGIAIGVEIINKYDICKIEYDDEKVSIDKNNYSECSAKEILSHKSKLWQYEEEWRVFSSNEYVDVKIVKIIIGNRMEDKDKAYIKKLVKAMNSEIAIKEQGNRIKIK